MLIPYFPFGIAQFIVLLTMMLTLSLNVVACINIDDGDGRKGFTLLLAWQLVVLWAILSGFYQ